MKERVCEICHVEYRYGKPFHNVIDEDGYKVSMCNYCFKSAKIIDIS